MKYYSLSIPADEYISRSNRLLSYLNSKKVTGIVLFTDSYIQYYSGFAFIPTERPIAFLMNSKGEKSLFVPRLEWEHAQSLTNIDQVVFYQEYPNEIHPMHQLSEAIKELNILPPFASDHNGYPWIFGYRGPSLQDIFGSPPLQVTEYIEDQIMVKSIHEIELIKESIKWSNLAHSLLQRYTTPGKTETEVSLRASHEATLNMLYAIGPIYRSQNAFVSGASADYRGQIGRNAAIPHALANNIVFRAGDVIVSGANAPVWGYNSELERTMVIGPANDSQKRLFDQMLTLQELAIQMLKPDIPCSQIDMAIRKYYEDHDLTPLWKHHTGHAIGLRYHESPFLDIGDNTVIKPGMVFTIEPGLYHPEVGGFRHSDTVLITDDGHEVLTYYPRDLESLTIPI
jgi:Xaa-Pro dipeptidase